MGLFRKSSKDARALPPVGGARERWSVAQGSHRGLPLIVRSNADARGWCGDARLPIKLGFAVPLVDPQPDGLPTPDENARLGEIEDVIVRAVAERTPGVFALAITTHAMREFVFYVPERVDFGELHDAIEREVGTHEVQCMAEHDAAWDAYRNFAAGEDGQQGREP